MAIDDDCTSGLLVLSSRKKKSQALALVLAPVLASASASMVPTSAVLQEPFYWLEFLQVMQWSLAQWQWHWCTSGRNKPDLTDDLHYPDPDTDTLYAGEV